MRSIFLQPSPASLLWSCKAPRSQILEDARRGGRRLSGTVKPHQIRLFAEPDQLATGVAAVLLHDERARRLAVAHAVEVLDHLAVDQPAERPRRSRHAARQQPSHLVLEAGLELRVDTTRQPLGQRRRRQPHRDRDRLELGQRRRRLGEMRGQGRPVRQ